MFCKVTLSVSADFTATFPELHGIRADQQIGKGLLAASGQRHGGRGTGRVGCDADSRRDSSRTGRSKQKGIGNTVGRKNHPGNRGTGNREFVALTARQRRCPAGKSRCWKSSALLSTPADGHGREVERGGRKGRGRNLVRGKFAQPAARKENSRNAMTLARVGREKKEDELGASTTERFSLAFWYENANYPPNRPAWQPVLGTVLGQGCTCPCCPEVKNLFKAGTTKGLLIAQEREGICRATSASRQKELPFGAKTQSRSGNEVASQAECSVFCPS